LRIQRITIKGKNEVNDGMVEMKVERDRSSYRFFCVGGGGTLLSRQIWLRCSPTTYPATLAWDIFIRLVRSFIVPDTVIGADADGDNFLTLF
jgi:hypothetical protein